MNPLSGLAVPAPAWPAGEATIATTELATFQSLLVPLVGSGAPTDGAATPSSGDAPTPLLALRESVVPVVAGDVEQIKPAREGAQPAMHIAFAPAAAQVAVDASAPPTAAATELGSKEPEVPAAELRLSDKAEAPPQDMPSPPEMPPPCPPPPLSVPPTMAALPLRTDEQASRSPEPHGKFVTGATELASSEATPGPVPATGQKMKDRAAIDLAEVTPAVDQPRLAVQTEARQLVEPQPSFERQLAATPLASNLAPSPRVDHALAPALPSATPTYPPVAADRAFGERVGLALVQRISERGEELVLRVEPADLGRVHVRLSFDEGGSLRATLTADSPGIVDMLQRDSGSLERALSDAGVRTDAQSFRFDRGTSGGNSSGQQQGYPAPRWGGAPDGAAPEEHNLLSELPNRSLRTSGSLNLFA